MTRSDVSELEQSIANSLSPSKAPTEGSHTKEESSSRVSSAFRQSPASATRSVPCITSASVHRKKSRTIQSAPSQHRVIPSRSSQPPVDISDICSEDYISGDDDDYEDDSVLRVDPSACVVSSPSLLYCGIARYIDFIRCLPVHLSKYILKLLDLNSLTNCLCISKHWRILAEEVQSDYMVHQLMSEEIMLMQVSSIRINY